MCKNIKNNCGCDSKRLVVNTFQDVVDNIATADKVIQRLDDVQVVSNEAIDTVTELRNFIEGNGLDNKVAESVSKVVDTELVNLKVQEEVDELASNLSRSVTEAERKADASIRLSTQVNNDLNVQTSRIDQLQTIPEGGTTADASLNDIKVGVDGTVYPTPGDAVREQVGNVESKINNIVEFKETSENIINHSTNVIGSYASGTNGVVSENVNYVVSDFISVKSGWVLSGYVAPNTETFPIIFYSDSKSFVSNGNADSTYSVDIANRRYKVTIPQGVSYVRVNIPTTQNNMVDLKVNLEYPPGASSSPYETPTLKRTSSLLVPIGIEDVKFKGQEAFKVSNGLFNPSKSVSGYISFSNGNINTSDVYKTSDFIAVKDNVTYTIQGITRYVLHYDVNRQPITSSFSQVVESNRKVLTGDTVKYIRFSYYAHSENTMYVVESSTPNFDTSKGNFYDSDESKLFGKKLITLGDSIVAGDGSSGFGLGQILASKNSMYLANYSRGGATIGLRSEFVSATTEAEKRLNIQHQVDSAITENSEADYILINGQTNDIDKASIIPIGSVTATYDGVYQTNTFAGGLETCFYKLKNKYPSAKLVYLIVHHIGSRTLNSQNERVAIAKQVCDKWSVPTVNMYDEGTINTFLSVYDVYTNNGDKTHPTLEGYNKFYTPLIESRLGVL